MHISDLHMGRHDADGDSLIPAQPPRWWAVFPYFSGFLGHSSDALEHLTTFTNALTSNMGAHEEERFRVFVTGDVSATGHEEEYDNARDFLNSTISLPSQKVVGLCRPRLMAHAIPGNHDHWPGSHFFLGGPTIGFFMNFTTCPFRWDPIDLGMGVSIVVVGIDSDDEVKPISRNRILARGRFRAQLTQAEAKLGAPDPNEIRVLMLHHSPAYVSAKFLRPLEIERRSRGQLDLLVDQREIALLLTGHAHVPVGRRGIGKNGRGNWEVLEGRCGTTTQRDRLPLSWAGVKNAPPFDLNTLLVHRVYRTHDGTKLYWSITQFVRDDLGFQPTGAMPGCALIQVWPRIVSQGP